MNSILITVRSGSTRLPKKAFLKIKGKTTIEHLIDRVKNSKLPDSIILCTTILPEDDDLCKIAETNNIKYYRGSVKDKLERWKGACEKYNVDLAASVLNWKGTKPLGAHDGVVSLKNGSLVLEEGKLIDGEFVIDMNSIKNVDMKGTEGAGKIEGHLM